MATKTPAQVAADYLTYLKTLRPDANTDQTDSDWWIRAQVVGGVVGGVYSDQRLLSNDAFPQSARHDALAQHLITYFNSGFLPATSASGNVVVTGTIGTVVPINTQFTYVPNGNTYQSSKAVTLAATAALIPVVSVTTGQSQNLLSGAVLNIASVPSGLNPQCSASGDIADGKDGETDAEAATRILARIQNPISGGTSSDYEQWAMQADPSVSSAIVQRFIAGLGTVGVLVTAGTTDIDTAIDNGQAIVRLPSQSLLAAVSGYIETVRPLTDCVHVLSPSEVAQDVTVNVTYAAGYSGSFVPAGQSLTLNQLIAREVSRALYKTPIGGRIKGNSGYVLASEIEEAIDVLLSDEQFITGSLAQLVIDRYVNNLSSSGRNRGVLSFEIVKPGTVNVVTF